MKNLKLAFLLSWFFLQVQAQKQQPYHTQVQKIAVGSIQLDGALDEEAWTYAKRMHNFWQNFPFDTSAAQAPTEVFVLYDDQNLYIGARCYGQRPGEIVVSSLRRDFSLFTNDYFMVILDTFEDGTNAFQFAVNPYGVQREALLANGGNRGDDDAWDNKWFAEVQRYDDHWTAEIAIPFKSIRFKNNATEWRVNFARKAFNYFEISSWVPVPRQFMVKSLAYTGTIEFQEPLKKPKSNIVAIPYLTSSYSQQFAPDPSQPNYRGNAGADFKIGIGPALNLDLTFNPDFSQVEVDQQITNLDRFELFFPERRQFFLENADLFATFGFSRIRPFFSRRIGIAQDTITGLIVQTPILYGARLSGKLTPDWRVGLLNMQTMPELDRGIQGKNYTVAAVQRQVFSRSNIAAIFVNEQTTSNESSDFILNTNQFNRVVGIDYNLASRDNTWEGKFFYHHLFTPDMQPGQFAHAVYLAYNRPTHFLMWNHEWVGGNYSPTTGFVPRRGLFRLEPVAGYTIFPESNKRIARHRFTSYNSLYWDENRRLTDRLIELRYETVFQNTASFRLAVQSDYVLLFFPFDPTNTGGERLPENSDYHNYRINIGFNTDRRKLFNLSAGARLGQYFNGSIWSIEKSLNYRFQPYGSVSLTGNFTRIQLPEPYNSADLILIGPRFDISFSRSLFWTTFVQYNNQIDNININTRLQWRFKPVSDIFVVYTDNYFANDFRQKNRALVIKATYWLNI